MSSDAVKDNGHVLYTDADADELKDATYMYVVEQGLAICKICGKGEVELEFPCSMSMKEVNGILGARERETRLTIQEEEKE